MPKIVRPADPAHERTSPAAARPRPAGRLLEAALIAAFALLVGVQTIGPFFVGLANNGDFEKVTGVLLIAPPQGWESVAWDWAVRNYVTSRQWWDSGLRSSETLLARIALGLDRLFGDADSFDIRVLGSIHALLLIAAFSGLVGLLRGAGPLVQVAVAVPAGWMFSDVYLTAYLNTFYMDAVAAVGMLLTVVLALRLLQTGAPSVWAVAAFTAAALLWTCSKSQHALWAWMAAAVPIATLRRRSDFRYHRAVLFASVAIVLSALWCVRNTPRHYVGSALSKLIFANIVPRSPTPADTAAEFGILPEEMKYVGADRVLAAGSPFREVPYMESFAARAGYGRVALYYLRHPGRAWSWLLESYSIWTADLRPAYLGNFPPGEGPPRARTTRFAIWSDLRSEAIRSAPLHLPLWYLAVFAGCGFVLLRGPLGWRAAAAVCLTLAAIGVLEFAVAHMADSHETDRHLFLFHVITDVTVVFGTAAACRSLRILWGRWSVSTRAGAPSLLAQL